MKLRILIKLHIFLTWLNKKVADEMQSDCLDRSIGNLKQIRSSDREYFNDSV